MKRVVFTALLLTALHAPVAFGHGEEKHPKTGRDAANAQQSVAPEAAEAVAALERFSTALSAGNLEAAGAELDASVLILESGGAERTRDEYLGGHAKSDAAFLKAAHLTLKRRTAAATGELAWVGSESEIHATKDGKPLAVASTETAILKKTAAGWKIVHLHWSSRRLAEAH
jgi:ketosteroid isomerase-like protein